MKPNIIYLYADDLGRGMLSLHGQRHFRTPNIDRIAGEGVCFTNFYGCCFCAPARASLLLGRHDCHEGDWTYTRGGIYKELTSGKMSLREVEDLLHKTGMQAGEHDVFLAQVAQQAGYVTGQIGKLEWGFATTSERIRRHGWEYHYGYYDHQRCHGFYPPFLFENGEKVDIPGNTDIHCGKNPEGDTPENSVIRHNRNGKAVFSQDLFDENILQFLRKYGANRTRPFFLFHPSQLPHGPIAIPEIHPAVRDNAELTEYEKEYASMVLRLDTTVGRILEELDELGIAENTVVFFCSDNGHQVYYEKEGRCTRGDKHDLAGNAIDNIATKFYSDTCGDIFDGNDGMAGKKWTSWEGGVRIPFMARWPGTIEPGTISDQLIANYDFLPTLADIAGAEKPAGKDGVSFLPALVGSAKETDQHDYVVFASRLGPALVTADGWKIRYIAKGALFQLYNLHQDYREEHDLADAHPEKMKDLTEKLLRACDGNLLNGTPRTHFSDYQERNRPKRSGRP